ncbi:MAG: N-6 DNA methylase [Dehalococcoidia bacterium]
MVEQLKSGTRIADACCGAGNLLISCAQYLPIGNNLKETLEDWSNFIVGYDIHDQFVRATRLRLVVLAISRHLDSQQNISLTDISQSFTRIRQGDVFDHLNILSDSDCIVANPPFGYTMAPKDCRWTSGKTQLAGIFIDELMQAARSDQHIVAILPDVLRSGTRYRRWRELIASKSKSLHTEIVGQFDNQTEVDVFIMHAVKKDANEDGVRWPESGLDSAGNNSKRTLSDFFEVRVGSVVPHRSALEGQEYPYIHAGDLLAWGTLNCIENRREFAGTVFRPPFVAVRRTSGPKDKTRCIGTIVDIDSAVAVENHLLVLSPYDKSLNTCARLIEILKCEKTSEWLNKRIRCRHITVSAMRELPWSTK